MTFKIFLCVPLLFPSITAVFLEEGYTSCGIEEDEIKNYTVDNSESSEISFRSISLVHTNTSDDSIGVLRGRRGSGDSSGIPQGCGASGTSGIRKLGRLFGIKKANESDLFQKVSSSKGTYSSDEGADNNTGLDIRNAHISLEHLIALEPNEMSNFQKNGDTTAVVITNDTCENQENDKLRSTAETPQKRHDEPATYHRILINLTRFYDDLKSYISGKRFDRIHFEKVIQNFRADLADIEFSVETELSSDIFKQKLQFSRQVFQSMVDACEKLKRYAHFSFPGSRLVYDMVELPIRILAMFTIDETLDRQIHDHPEKLKLLGRVLENRGRDFKNITYVRPGVREVFAKNEERARVLLEKLTTG